MTLGAAARDDMEKTGILASLTVAQGILESGWGASGLAANHNNFFGIKKGSGWTGAVAVMQTQEWDGAKYVTVGAEFRKYPDMAASIADHSALFLRLERYKALRGETDYQKACAAVKAAGYATSPTYTKSLTDLIEARNLTQFDKPAANPSAGEASPGAAVFAEGVRVGSLVTIRPSACYGGLSSARGTRVPAAQTAPKRHTVSVIKKQNGRDEALLKEIFSWVPVAELTTV